MERNKLFKETQKRVYSRDRAKVGNIASVSYHSYSQGLLKQNKQMQSLCLFLLPKQNTSFNLNTQLFSSSVFSHSNTPFFFFYHCSEIYALQVYDSLRTVWVGQLPLSSYVIPKAYSHNHLWGLIYINVCVHAIDTTNIFFFHTKDLPYNFCTYVLTVRYVVDILFYSRRSINIGDKLNDEFVL